MPLYLVSLHYHSKFMLPKFNKQMKYIYGMLFLFTAFLSSCNLDSVDDPTSKNEVEIQNYIKQRNLTMQKSPDGLYYQLNTSGSTGKLKNLGDLVSFHYKLTLLDGTLVDSTSRAKNINRSAVWGLSETVFTLPLSLLKEGESGLFLVPSALAFGEFVVSIFSSFKISSIAKCASLSNSEPLAFSSNKYSIEYYFFNDFATTEIYTC